jgi:hypothetical protein
MRRTVTNLMSCINHPLYCVGTKGLYKTQDHTQLNLRMIVECKVSSYLNLLKFSAYGNVH